VQQTGNFSVDLRVASLNGGAQILVQVDDSVSIGGIVAIAVTGGWQTWKTVHVGEQALAVGKHKLRILFVKGGLNLNYIQFSIMTGVQDDEKQKPYSFGLEQNYPNPFNPTTRIKFSSTGSYVQLKVYDAVGREVQTLADGQLSPGYHEVTFNADGLPSGVYYCRLQSGNDIQTLKMELVK